MKKFIQIGSLLSLLVLFTAGTTLAQVSFGTDVNIPFAFTVGDHSFDAGNYIVRFERLASGSATLSIQDTKTEEVERVLMNANGDSVTGEIKLVFDTIDGQRYLTKVNTPDRSYAVLRSKSEKDAAERVRAKEKGEAVIGGGANLF